MIKRNLIYKIEILITDYIDYILLVLDLLFC